MRIFSSQLCFILLLNSLLFCQEPVTHDWNRTNPGGGGAFSTIGAGPNGIIIAGSDLSGAYRSLDHGQSWDVIGASRGLFETHVAGMGFHPFDENIIFLGTDNGIYRSENCGETFTKVYSRGYITDIEVSKSNPAVVYAAFRSAYNKKTGRIMRSTDNGKTWSVLRSDFPANMPILKVLCDPADENIVYCLTGMSRFVCGNAGVFQSLDGGSHWTGLASEVGQILDIAIDEKNPETLYLSTVLASCNAKYYWTSMYGKFYKSTDRGVNWSLLSNNTGVIFVDPDSAGVIRLLDPREINAWREEAGTYTSVDSGITFTLTGFAQNWDCGYQGVYDPEWSTCKSYGTSFNGIATTLGTDMSDPKVILWVNKQFAFRSEDNGTSFENIYTREVKPGWWQSRGFDNIDMIDLVINPVNQNIIYMGLFDIGFWRSLDHGESWQSCNSPHYTGSWKGYGGNVAGIAADPTRVNVVWTTMSQHQKGDNPTYLLRSDSTAARSSWVLSNNGLPTEELMGLSVDPTSPEQSRTLFVTAQGDVYKSTDDGYNWTKVFENNGCRFTAVDFYDGNLVYAGGGSGLWRSTDGGDNWKEVGLPEMRGKTDFWASGGQGVFDIHPDIHHTGRVYVTSFGTDKGLWRSEDGGLTWEKLLTDRYMRRVAVSPLNPDIIYTTSSCAFTHGGYNSNSKGVLVSFDRGENWSQANDGMAWPFAICVELDKQGTVFVGSSGTGFQKAQVPNVSGIKSYGGNNTINYKLKQNYPNPFNPGTTIEYSLAKNEFVEIKIYNSLGRTINTLVAQEQQPGEYTVDWDGRDDSGKKIASGVYFYQLAVGKQKSFKKMILLD